MLFLESFKNQQMKVNSILLVLVALSIVACGPKINNDAYVKDVDSYVSNLAADTHLKTNLSQGVLTDDSGFNDVGTFSYQERMSPDGRELFHIKNVEKTDQTITENYYYKDNRVVFITVNTNSEAAKKLYVKKGSTLSRVNLSKSYEKILLNKAKLFKKQFKSAR